MKNLKKTINNIAKAWDLGEVISIIDTSSNICKDKETRFRKATFTTKQGTFTYMH